MKNTATPSSFKHVELRQICYSADTLASVPNGMLALDNSENTRPDWREYWPIRQFLLNHTLADDTLYGFLSPRFGDKTGLSSQQVQDHVASDQFAHSVYVFNPFWDLSSFFVNVFEQGEFFHPGLKKTTEYFIETLNLPFDAKLQVTHSQNTVFCNYTVASKAFWLKWLSLSERLMFAAEHPQADPLLQQWLNADARYGEQSVSMKVIVMKRLATLLLMSDATLSVNAYDSFQLPASNTPLNRFFTEALQCNALKLAYAQSQSPFNLHAFMQLRDQVFQQLHAKAA